MLDKTESIDFVESKFGHGDLTNAGLNIAVLCPFCLKEKGIGYNKRKLVIRTDNHLVHCWRCDYRSKNLMHLLRVKAKDFGLEALKEYEEVFLSRLLRDEKHRVRCVTIYNGLGIFDDYLEDVENVKIEPAKLPDSFIFLANEINSKDRYIQYHLKYLASRGLSSEEDLWYWKFCVAPQEDKEYSWRVIIPSFDAKGELNFISGRSIFKNTYIRYLNCTIPKKNIIFNECFIDWKKPLWLVEGPFDLCKMRTVTSNATCLLGKTMNESYELMRKIIENRTPIILALDPKEDKQKIRLASSIQSFGSEVRIFDYPKGVEDIGSLSHSEMKQLAETGTHLYNDMDELKTRIRKI